MVFNKSWSFLKSVNDWSSVGSLYGDDDDDGEPNLDKRYTPTMDNSYQKILPQDDLTLDYRTGWKGVEPVTAIRYQGDFPAGSPVSQGHYNTSFEGNTPSNGFPKNSPEVDFNAPSVEAPHGETAPTGWKNRPPTDKDADYGYPDKGGWLYRDPENGAHYWYKNGVKNFMDVREGGKGSWWSKAQDEDFDRAAGSEYDPTKIVALRGDPNKYGVASQRDSHEAKEKLSEMYLQHNKNIPPHQLVEIPMRQNIPGEQNEDYLTAARRMGIPKRRNKSSSRWSDEPLPFGKSRVKKPLEDLTEEELYDQAGTDTPMKKAFQLLKDYPVDEDEDKLVQGRTAAAQQTQDFYGITDGLVRRIRGPMFRERRRHIQQALEDAYNFQPEFVGSIPKKQATLSARHKGRRMFVGATGREYETREHRAAVEPSTETQEVTYYDWGYTNPRTKNEWAPPKPPVNPNVDEPYDEMYNQYYNVATGEPMEITFQLLKNIQEDEDMDEGEDENTLYDYFNSHIYDPEMQDENTYNEPENLDEFGNTKNYSVKDYWNSVNAYLKYRERQKWKNNRLEPYDVERPLMSLLPEDHPEYTTRLEWENRKLASKPMNIAFQLLKERKSPAAFAHKLEYDKQYQKTPKRVKYREQLNTERRKRGIYGKGGKDVSHTQGGKLTLESAHSNRARHFKNKGTLRRVKVKK